MKRLLASSLLAAALASVPVAASAATATNTLTVQANVIASCRILAQTLTFLNYDGMVNLASADVTVECNAATAHWIGLDNGLTGARQMRDAALNPLGYELFRDAARTVTWDTANPDPATWTLNTAGSVQTVYGRIPAGQIVPVGNYSDSVTMTVNF